MKKLWKYLTTDMLGRCTIMMQGIMTLAAIPLILKGAVMTAITMMLIPVFTLLITNWVTKEL